MASVYRLSLHNATKSASSLLSKAALLVTPAGDEALAELDTAVDLALLHVLNLDLGHWLLDLNALEAVKGARSLGLEAALHVEGLDEALSEVDAAVLLAGSHLALNFSDGGFFNGGEAAEGASSLGGEASLGIEGGDKALSKVDAAVLLAGSHTLDLDFIEVKL